MKERLYGKPCLYLNRFCTVVDAIERARSLQDIQILREYTCKPCLRHEREIDPTSDLEDFIKKEGIKLDGWE